MTVKLTWEFRNVEEAIVFLGKQIKGAPQALAQSAPAVNGPAPAVAPTRTRKPRADAGKPRGKYKAGAPAAIPGTDTAPSSEPAAPAPENAAPEKAPAEGDKPQPSGVVPAPVAADPNAPTLADVQRALEAMYDKCGMNVAQSVASSFTAGRVRDMDPANYGPFIEAANKKTAEAK